MQIRLRLARPAEQLLLAPPLRHGHQPDGDLALALNGVDVADGRGDGGTPADVGDVDVAHVGDGGVGVGDAVGLVAGVLGPAGEGRGGGDDEHAGVLLEEVGEVLHEQVAQLVVLHVVAGGGLGADGHGDLVGVVDDGLPGGRVRVAVAGEVLHLGHAGGGVHELDLAEVGDADVDDGVALGFEVVDGGAADGGDGTGGLGPPRLVDGDRLGGGRRGWDGRGVEALDRVVGVGPRHEAVGDGEVGDGGGQGADDAHGGVHGAGAVVGGLEAVDAVEGGGDADGAAGVGADGDGDDAGAESGPASGGGSAGVVGLVVPVCGRSPTRLRGLAMVTNGSWICFSRCSRLYLRGRLA